jgi:uncharacterized DUF497 family protein
LTRLLEWDEAKAAADLNKHQISFADAACVVDDPGLCFVTDPGLYQEQRFIAIGLVNARLIAAIYTSKPSPMQLPRL